MNLPVSSRNWKGIQYLRMVWARDLTQRRRFPDTRLNLMTSYWRASGTCQRVRCFWSKYSCTSTKILYKKNWLRAVSLFCQLVLGEHKSGLHVELVMWRGEEKRDFLLSSKTWTSNIQRGLIHITLIAKYSPQASFVSNSLQTFANFTFYVFCCEVAFQKRDLGGNKLDSCNMKWGH